MKTGLHRCRSIDGSVAFAAPATLIGAVIGLAATSGCAFLREWQSAQPSAATAETTSPDDLSQERSDSIFDRPFRRIVVRFSVFRVSAPKGTFTFDDRMWKLVDSPIQSAALAMRMKDNGFRAAVGAKSDREPFLRYVEQIAEARNDLEVFTPSESRLVEIDFGPCDDRQSVCHIDRMGNLHGRTFEDARALLILEYEMRSASLDEVWIRLMPAIQEPPGPWKWEITELGARQVQEERRYAYRDLVFEAKIQDGGFLLLGPTADLYELPLLGRPYFLQPSVDANGRPEERETIFVISPLLTSYEQAATGGGENR
ncbi:MAG: hypothetical protein O7B26_03290 [Planctomycetota bacterium]|nr:hypothetical protein [Planctomycetota bacterium]